MSVQIMLKLRVTLLLLVTLLASLPTYAGALRLGVQPMLDDVDARVDWRDFAAYLSERLGQPVEVVQSRDVLSFWRGLHEHEFDLVLATSTLLAPSIRDGVLMGVARSVPERVYQLAVRRASRFRSADDLQTHTVAGQGAPSSASLSFSMMYPDPAKQPDYQVVDSVDAALDALRGGHVDAVMLPTSRLEKLDDLRVVATSRLSVAPVLAADLYVSAKKRQAVREALASMGTQVVGLRALDHAWLGGFEALGDNEHLADADLLQRYWYY